MRVLLADRDEIFLEVAQRFLTNSGHEVKIATNGLESVAALQRDRPDVAVLQRELLWGGSEGVLAVMEQDPRWSTIPVILTSDDGPAEASGKTAGPPLAGQLQKPYRLEQLLGHLRAYQVDGPLNPK